MTQQKNKVTNKGITIPGSGKTAGVIYQNNGIIRKARLIKRRRKKNKKS